MAMTLIALKSGRKWQFFEHKAGWKNPGTDAQLAKKVTALILSLVNSIARNLDPDGIVSKKVAKATKNALLIVCELRTKSVLWSTAAIETRIVVLFVVKTQERVGDF